MASRAPMLSSITRSGPQVHMVSARDCMLHEYACLLAACLSLHTRRLDLYQTRVLANKLSYVPTHPHCADGSLIISEATCISNTAHGERSSWGAAAAPLQIAGHTLPGSAVRRVIVPARLSESSHRSRLGQLTSCWLGSNVCHFGTAPRAG